MLSWNTATMPNLAHMETLMETPWVCILNDRLAEVPADSQHHHPDTLEKMPPNDSSPKLFGQPSRGVFPAEAPDTRDQTKPILTVPCLKSYPQTHEHNKWLFYAIKFWKL